MSTTLDSRPGEREPLAGARAPVLLVIKTLRFLATMAVMR